MIEDAYSKVTEEVHRKEAPFSIRNCLWSVKHVIDSVYPHETSVVQEINRDHCIPILAQVRPVFGAERCNNRCLTINAYLVEIAYSIVVRLGFQLFVSPSIFFRTPFLAVVVKTIDKFSSESCGVS